MPKINIPKKPEESNEPVNYDNCGNYTSGYQGTSTGSYAAFSSGITLTGCDPFVKEYNLDSTLSGADFKSEATDEAVIAGKENVGLSDSEVEELEGKELGPVVYIPEDAKTSEEDWMPLSPPTTEYESRRTSIGRDAYRQVTGK